MTSSDAGTATSRWEPPALALKQPQPQAQSQHPAAEPAVDNGAAELERLRQEARDAGYAEGLAAGRARVEESAQELGQLLEALAHPFRASDAALLRSLVDLVESVVRAVLQRELAAGLDLEPVLRDALAALDDSPGTVEILVSPEDRSLLESIAGGLEAQVLADASVARGGIVLRSGASTVDATLEARLAEAMASLRDAAGVPGADDSDADDKSNADDPRGS